MHRMLQDASTLHEGACLRHFGIAYLHFVSGQLVFALLSRLAIEFPLQMRLDAAPDLASRMRMHDACHADSITALLAAEGLHGRILLSASRDGIVKGWK